MTATLAPGRLIGSYEIIGQIGVGGAGRILCGSGSRLGWFTAMTRR